MLSKPFKKPRIAWFSPLTGDTCSAAGPSAYLTRTLIDELQGRFDIVLVSDFEDRAAAVPVVHFLRAFDMDRESPFDLWVYQLENSKATWFCRMHLAIQPGLVIFHDLLLSDYGPDPMTSTPSNELLDGYLSENQYFPSLDTFWKPEGPYAFREAAYSPVKCFTSRKDIAEWRRTMSHRPALGDKAWFLPYPVSPAASSRPVIREGSRLRVGFAGAPGIEQRSHVVLEALRGAAVHTELVWLIDPAERATAEALIKEFDVESATLVEGRNPERWQSLLVDIDITIHLHFSVFDSPGPYLPVSICSGVPTVLSEFGDALTLPRDFFFFVQPGQKEVFELREVLSQFALLSAAQRSTLCDRLKGYGQEIHSTKIVAGELGMVIEHSIDELSTFMERWRIYRAQARASLLGSQPLNVKSSNEWYSRYLSAAFEEIGWTGSKTGVSR